MWLALYSNRFKIKSVLKGEKEYIQRFTFKEPIIENYEKFQREIEEKERNGIHQYSIEPIGHKNKPREGEILELEISLPT